MERTFLLVFLFFCTGISASNFSVTCIGKPNLHVRVVAYVDEFSGKTNVILDTITDVNGKFSFNFSSEKITHLELRTTFCFGRWFSEPNKKYNISMVLPDTTFFASENNLPEIHLQNLDTLNLGLNDSIIAFEKDLDDFYRTNLANFIQQRLRLLAPELEKFKANIAKKYYSPPGSFLDLFVKYSMAPIEEAAYQNKKAVFLKYFSGSPYFEHPIYVEFFKKFFTKYILIVSNKTSTNFITNDINLSASIDLLEQHFLQKDTLLLNDTLRQMVFIYNLYELFYEKNFERKQIEKMLKQFASGKAISKFNALVAGNYLASLDYLDYGIPAPDFTLQKTDGSEFSLSSLKGKWVFLSFVAAWDKQSLAELKALNKIALKYSLKINFVTIVLEGNDEEMINLMKVISKEIILLDDRERKITFEKYYIKEFPKFVFLDEDLDIYSTSPLFPSNNLEGFIRNNLKRKN